MKQKLPFILETIWLVVLVASLVAAIYQTSIRGFQDSLMLYLVAFLASLMYISRRYFRKTREKTQNHNK